MDLRRSLVRLACALALACVGAFALDCRSATAVRLVITTDGCARLTGTTIFVATRDTIESDTTPVAGVNGGCTDAATRLVGSLVIYPRDSKDASVALKILSGVGVDPSKCRAPAYEGCIVARREFHFTPHEEIELDVLMSLACQNLSCTEHETCVANAAGQGDCVGVDKIPDQPPPGTILDGGGDAVSDGNNPPPPPPTDGGVDAAIDSGPRVTCDPAVCTGGRFGGCDPSGFCKIDCKGGANDCSGNTCPNNFDCHITCDNQQNCDNFDCTTTGKCIIDCNNQDTCANVSCHGASCAVNCNGQTSCDKVRVDAGSTAVTCGNTGNKASCKDVECAGGSCTMSCAGAGNAGCAGGNQDCCAGTCSGPFDGTGACPRP